MTSRARWALGALIGAGALACGGDAASPEAQVRATLAAAESAAEARDAAALKEWISEAYHDDAGNDRRAVGALVGMHLLQQRSVHLLTRTVSLEIPRPGEATAQVLVAMAGSPIDGPELLAGVRADLYRFDLELRDEDGSWRVVSAAWRPAALDDFR